MFQDSYRYNIKQVIMRLKLILYFYCLLDIAFNFTIGINLLKKYSELRKKISKALNKQENELMLRTNEYEYPRANETLRSVHKEIWQEYYDCLNKAYNEIGPEKTMYPKALVVLEGALIVLKCEICISPTEMYQTDNIEWYFNSTSNNKMINQLVQESDDTFISPEDGSLFIYNIKFDQSGQYWCKLGDTLSVSYHVTIDNNIEGVRIVHPATAPNMPHAMPKKILTEYNLNIHTTWTKWSSCSKCNVVGKKFRYGYCTISLYETAIKRNTGIRRKHLQNYKRQNDADTKTLETATESVALNANVKEKVEMVLQVFRNNIPCKSKYLPKKLLDIPDIKNRKTELMERYCKVKCPKNIVFEVRDKHGNIIESANNSAGIYSMIQGIPETSPQVMRTTIYQTYRKRAVLTCPGTLHVNIPIIWKVDNKVLNPAVIKEQSHGKIHINPQMHIIFESLNFEDTNIYSCWQKDKIIGIVKLNVTGEFELEIDYSIIMIGGTLIVLVFLLVFWRAFQGRNRFTIH